MAKTATEVRELVHRFVQALEEQSRCTVELVVLYGSYARDEAHRLSDIDLAVVSRDFAKLPRQRVRDTLRATEEATERSIHALAYTVKEYKAAPRWTFLGEIKRTGKVIYRRGA